MRDHSDPSHREEHAQFARKIQALLDTERPHTDARGCLAIEFIYAGITDLIEVLQSEVVAAGDLELTDAMREMVATTVTEHVTRELIREATMELRTRRVLARAEAMSALAGGRRED